MRRQGQPNDVNLVKTPASVINSQRQQEVNDQIFHHVQEMFDGKVDGDVVFIILQELEWNGVLSKNLKHLKLDSLIDASVFFIYPMNRITLHIRLI